MTRAARRFKRSAAFTLVEVLATLVLAAIILPVAMRGISMATAAAGETKRRSEAAALADAKLAELVVTGDWQGSEMSGEFLDDRSGYRWSAEVSDWEDPTVRQLAVSVEWSARGSRREVTVVTLVPIEDQ